MGGRLTAVASVWLEEPRIAEHALVLWCGGREYDGLGAVPFPQHPRAPLHETNTGIDVAAAQVVFNDSALRVWQVPRDVYATVTVSRAELQRELQPAGAIGAHLFDALSATPLHMAAHGFGMGEVIGLGDNPLVLLTALTAGWSRMPESSASFERTRQVIEDDGRYGAARTDGATTRIFTRLDVRLLLGDLFAKLATLASAD